MLDLGSTDSSPLGADFITIEGGLDEAAARRLDRDARSIHINSEGAFGESLDAILPWADSIERLVVTDFGIEDVSAVMRMHSLRELALWPSSRATPNLAFRHLPTLKVLAIDGHLKFTLNGAESIVDLSIERASIASVVEVESMAGITRLRLMRPKAVPRIIRAPVKDLTIQSFKCSGIQDGHKIEPIRGIEGLHRIRLDSVSGLADLRVFSRVENIRWIYIDNCGDLCSLDGISLSADTEIHLVGATPARFKGGSE